MNSKTPFPPLMRTTEKSSAAKTYDTNWGLFCMRPLVEETVELSLLLLFKLCHPYYNHLDLESCAICLEIKTKPNRTSKKNPNNKRFQSKANAIVKVLMTELFKACSTTKVPHPDTKQNLSWSCCQCI